MSKGGYRRILRTAQYIIKLSTGLNPLTHAGHVAQDVEWNIGCAKPAAVWH